MRSNVRFPRSALFITIIVSTVATVDNLAAQPLLPQPDPVDAFLAGLLLEVGTPDLDPLILDPDADFLLQLALMDDAEREAYIAAAIAELNCETLLDALAQPLGTTPIYALNGGMCETAAPSGADFGRYFSDPGCTAEVSFRPTDTGQFCTTRFGDQASGLLGNADAWEPEPAQSNDPLPTTPSLPWTTAPGTLLDIGVLPLEGNRQPYLKRLSYRVVSDVSRGNGRCALEMRVYKTDITAQGLKPLLAIHGGTWRYRGFAFFGLEMLISHLTEQGFIVFAPFYRLVGESDGNIECNGADWRALTADVEAALDWVRENGSALGAMGGPVSVFGQSAGAHLAAWLAAHRAEDVRKAMLYYGPMDFLGLLSGAVPAGAPHEDSREFVLASLTRLFGAHSGAAEVQLQRIDFPGMTAATLAADWDILIPGAVFDLSTIDPASPPGYVTRCAESAGIDLTAINLALPPGSLTDCMKRELRDFLLDNSFNALLGDENIPIHAVHGSGDTLVPHLQTVALCGAIDGSVLSPDVIVPLTSYECGADSQAQIIMDAEHILELGVCLGSVCPAGPSGSPTREAVTTAIETSHDWLSTEPLTIGFAPPVSARPPPARSGGSGGVDWLTLLGLLVARCVWGRAKSLQSMESGL